MNGFAATALNPPQPLLAADEPPPFRIENPHAGSAFVLVSDHAGRAIPRALGDLGVAADELQRHIAWDIGAAGLASELARRLDAWLIQQTYSRLVIDCNRPPGAPGSVVQRSERTEVPGNRDLGAAQRLARQYAIFDPYHQHIAAELDARQRAGRAAILVSIHSFTPVYLDQPRAWHVGVLYGRDGRLAQPLLQAMRADRQWQVGDNQPYAVSDQTDYAVPVHGERRGLLHVAIEVRQDLIADEAGQAAWAARLQPWLQQAAAIASGQAAI